MIPCDFWLFRLGTTTFLLIEKLRCYEQRKYLTTFSLYSLLLVNCGIPVAPENGSIAAVPSTLGGAEIIFRCNTGFVPTGNMTAMCMSNGVSPNGTWTPNPATLTCNGKF